MTIPRRARSGSRSDTPSSSSPSGWTGPRPRPAPGVAGRPGRGRRVGPYPGYNALDIDHLRSEDFSYFRAFRPVARVGSAIAIHHVTKEEADRVRHDLGLPLLGVPSPPPIPGRGFLRRDDRDESGDTCHYTVFVPGPALTNVQSP